MSDVLLLLFFTFIFLVPLSGQTRADFSNLQDPFATPDFNKLYRGTASIVTLDICIQNVKMAEKPYFFFSFFFKKTHWADSLFLYSFYILNVCCSCINKGRIVLLYISNPKSVFFFFSSGSCKKNPCFHHQLGFTSSRHALQVSSEM